MNRLGIAAAVFAAAALTVCSLRAQSDEATFLDGLRQRRLFRLAQEHCRQLLANDQLSEKDRALTTIELIRSYATHAYHSPPAERAARWQAAHETAAAFEREHNKNPRLILVRMQDALTWLAEGELNRQEAEVGVGNQDALQAARERIRQAARALEKLDAELSDIRRETNNGGLTSDELYILQNNVLTQLARAYRNQALSYPAGSPDRTAALTAALEQHKKLATRLTEDDPLFWTMRVDRVVSLRGLGRLQEAAQEAVGVMRGGPPGALLHARAELARIYLDAKQPDKALETLAAGRTSGGQISAELDFAHLQTYLALWRAAEKKQDEKQSTEWQKRSAQIARLMEDMHGLYWSRRADLLLTRTAGSSGGARDLEILVRAADSQFLKGEFKAAVDAYDKAAQTARKGNDAEQAFAMAYKAALVMQQKLGQHDQAGRRLQALAMEMKTHPQASRAHLLAIWNASQAAAKDSQAMDWYAAALEEHLENWKQGDTAWQVRIWLGRLLQHQRSWRKAIEAYGGIASDSPHFAPAMQSAAQCWLDWLDELKENNQPYDKHAEAAARYFEDVLLGADKRLPRQFDKTDQLSVLTAARVRLQYTPSGHKAAAGLLQAAINGSPMADAAWKTEAESLLVVALAGQADRRDEARVILRRLADGKPQQLLTMLDGLSKVAATSPASVRGEIAALQLDAIGLLAAKREQLDEQTRGHIARIEADALVRGGQTEKGLALYRQLIAAHPNDGALQIAYARLLLESKDPDKTAQSLSRWRLIASRSRPQTDAWYEAKYSVALCQFLLGQKKDAAKLIRYVQATVPGLKNTPWNARFTELLRKCQ